LVRHFLNFPAQQHFPTPEWHSNILCKLNFLSILTRVLPEDKPMSDPVLSSVETVNEIARHHKEHWHSSNRIVLAVLLVWFWVSLGGSILFREFLDVTFPSVGGAPFGFWMAQQGSILCFVILLVVYRSLMNRLDHKHGLEDHA
jgi:putative solute:sodium symporter small subunit